MTRPSLAALAVQTGLGKAQMHVVSLARGGPHWAEDDGRFVYPASMIKLPLAVAAAVAVARHRLTWNTPVEVDPRNETPNDAPSPMVAGYVSTVEELVRYMLQRSDNVATNQLFDALDRERATADVRALGYPETAFRRKLSGSDPLIDDPQASGRNAFPAREAAALFAAIARDEVPGAGTLRTILATSWWDVKLSRGLATGDTFAHKTGDTSEVSHDGGILSLRDGSRWIVVVYTELPSSEENDLRFGAFMRALRPHLLTSPDPWSTG